MRIYYEDYYEDLLFIFEVKLKSLMKSFLSRKEHTTVASHNEKDRVSNSV